MKQEKSYEEKIADIKRYLKEKEAEVESNKITEVRRNPLNKERVDYNNKKEEINFDNDINEKYKDLEKARKNIAKFSEFDYVKNNEKKKQDLTNNVFDNENIMLSSLDFSSKEDLNDKKIEKNNLSDNKLEKDEVLKEETNKESKETKSLNILLVLCLVLTPIFITLSFISSNTTYLIKKPINYIVIILSFVGIIGIATFSILKFKKNKGKKNSLGKHVVACLITSVLDIIFLILFITNQMWNCLDFIIENKILFIILIMILLLITAVIFIVRKKLKKSLKQATKNIILSALMTLYVLCYFDFLIVLYGPSTEFKNWLITTAMQTMNHQYFCRWFYSEDDINYILSQNYVLESGESTNPDLIDLDNEEKAVYENEYEEAVLKKDNPDDAYKIITFEVNGCKAYLAVIYDPTTVKVAVSKNVGVSGQYVTTMAENNNALLAINGGGFYDPNYSSAGGMPMGITIVDGKIVTNGEYGNNVQSGGIIGFDDEGILYLLKNKTAQEAIDMGITSAVSWGPFLIVNGEPSFIKGNGGWGYAARTAIGQRKDGIVLFLVVDSNATRTNGADMVDLTEIMQNYGAVNAANLDGGTSSVMVLPKKQALKYRDNCTDNYCYINDPIDGGLSHRTRAIADSFVVIEK